MLAKTIATKVTNTRSSHLVPVMVDSSSTSTVRRVVVTFRKPAVQPMCTFVLGKDSRGVLYRPDRRMTVPDLSPGGQVAEIYEVTKWAKICV